MCIVIQHRQHKIAAGRDFQVIIGELVLVVAISRVLSPAGLGVGNIILKQSVAVAVGRQVAFAPVGIVVRYPEDELFGIGVQVVELELQLVAGVKLNNRGALLMAFYVELQALNIPRWQNLLIQVKKVGYASCILIPITISIAVILYVGTGTSAQE